MTLKGKNMLLAKGKDLRQTPDFFHRSVWIYFLKDTACFTGCNIWKVCSKFPISECILRLFEIDIIFETTLFSRRIFMLKQALFLLCMRKLFRCKGHKKMVWPRVFPFVCILFGICSDFITNSKKGISKNFLLYFGILWA